MPSEISYGLKRDLNNDHVAFSADVQQNKDIWFKRYASKQGSEILDVKRGRQFSYSGARGIQNDFRSGVFEVNGSERVGLHGKIRGDQATKTVPAPASKCYGAAWDGEGVWTVLPPKGGTGHIYKVSMSDGTILKSFSVTRGGDLVGGAWTGQYIYFGSDGSAWQYQWDKDGNFYNAFNLEGEKGTWDGSYFVTMKGDGRLTLYDDQFNQVLQSDTSDPNWSRRDITWDGRYFYELSANPEYVYRYSREDVYSGSNSITFDDAFQIDAGGPKTPDGSFSGFQGLDWDGRSMIVLNNTSDTIYRVASNQQFKVEVKSASTSIE